MTDQSLLRACQDAPWDMVARGIYADWLDEHGEAETAAKFRDPQDGPTLLSLLPEPVWHPPIVMAGGRYELPHLSYTGTLGECLCVALNIRRCAARAPGTLPIVSESLRTNKHSFRIVSVGGQPWVDWHLTWDREDARMRVMVGREPEPQMWYASNLPDPMNWEYSPN